MSAIHLQVDGSTCKGQQEEFLSRTQLPEADRLVIEGLRVKYVPPPLPKPEGPGRQ